MKTLSYVAEVSPRNGHRPLSSSRGQIPLPAAARLGLTLWLCVVVGAGCSTTDPDTIDRDFGSSVRRMVEAQKVAPTTVSTEPMPMDGPKAQEVLAAYRADVANQKQAEQPIQLVIGGGE